MRFQRRAAFRHFICVMVAEIVVAGCSGHSAPPPSAKNLDAATNARLAQFLPQLADFPGPSWDVTLTAGPPKYLHGPYIDPSFTVEPTGCGDIPFQRSEQIAAATEGSVPNGIAGDGGESAVRLIHDRPGSDLVAESVAWAKRCHEFRVRNGPADPEFAPTAVSVLPPIQLNGVEVTRIHLTDNSFHRDQAAGSRESVVLLARQRGLVVEGFRHDSGRDTEDLLTLTLERLRSGKPASKPLSGTAPTDGLGTRSDDELRRLLPSFLDLPAGWVVDQSSPVNDYSDDSEYDSRVLCDRIPFDRAGRRPDSGRDFHEVAAVTATQGPDDARDTDLVRLAVEIPGKSVVDETITWANNCTSFLSDGRRTHTVELMPSSTLGDATVTSVRYVNDSTLSTGDTVSLLRIRGVLVITKPALSSRHGPLAEKVVDNLRHAAFDTPRPPARASSPPVDHDEDNSAGLVMPPPATADADRRLARVAHGSLVNPAPYHFAGYLPGDASTRSPDYLHFRSPTGAIACTQHKWLLFCAVQQGTYRRTPTPPGGQENWDGSVVTFGWNGIHNGDATTDPVVYAESETLPYGSTIRLADDIECLMERDGLTCLSYGDHLGMHLSRQDLTPLTPTSALTPDTRAEPK